MAIHAAFKGHGTFVYNAQSTLERFKDTSGAGRGVVKAFQAMGFSSAWVRLFGVAGAVAHAPTLELVNALRRGGIKIAGWGYCHGADWETDLSRSINQCDRYGIEAFVADVEPGNSTTAGKTKWSRADFRKYLDGLRRRFAKDNLAVSTWPVPKIQDAFDSVELMKIAASRVGMFAPQAYWMRYPKKVHYDATGFKESKYPKDSPESFVRLVIDAWRKMGIDNPLVITGQVYWGEGGPSQSVIEDKLETFVETFQVGIKSLALTGGTLVGWAPKRCRRPWSTRLSVQSLMIRSTRMRSVRLALIFRLCAAAGVATCCLYRAFAQQDENLIRID